MLPTNNRTKLYLSDFNKVANLASVASHFHTGYHLHVLSDEQPQEGDWSYDRMMKSIGQRSNVYSSKIIVTSDKSIKQFKCCMLGENSCEKCPEGYKSLPQFSDVFIHKFVTEYNKGNVITEVEVKYDEYIPDWELDMITPIYENKLKINSDNTITIKQIVEKTYTETEVINILIDLYDNQVDIDEQREDYIKLIKTLV